MTSNTARVPITPLSMDNSEAALNNELVVDYKNYQIFIHANGEFYNVTASINALVNEIKNMFKNDQDTMLDIFKSDVAGTAIGEVIIRTMEGNTVTIREYIDKSINQFKEVNSEIKNTNSNLKETNNNITKINNTIKTINEELEKIKNTEVVSKAQIASWDSKARIFHVDIKVPTTGWVATGSVAPYTIEVECPGVLQTDRPVISLINPGDIDTAMLHMKNLNFIYDAESIDGYMRFFATQPITTEISIQVKVDRTEIPEDEVTE